MEDQRHYDVLVIGSGFGGSVTALRLAEKGYRVGVIEAGRRFADHEFAKTSWQIASFLWAPWLGCYGIQRVTLLRNVMVLSGAGVGGGSLVYANALYEPLAPFYADPQWAHITDWREELKPYYDRAKRMLGVVENPTHTASDAVMRAVAEEMGAGHTFCRAPVAVFFARPGEPAPDPYFGGVGPDRRGCTECGSCLTGCRVGAKNTLVKNYLYLAERAGARVHPLRTVTTIRPRVEGGYVVEAVGTGVASTWRRRQVFTADQVVLAAGALGTQRLLHEMRDRGLLPHLSPRLGELTRTNSESVVGANSLRKRTDFSRGVAITSSFRPDAHTQIEPVRYGKGSNAMGLLETLLVDGDGPVPKWLKLLGTLVRRPWLLLWPLWLKGWSERTIILLVMQARDNSLTTYTKRTIFGRRKLTSRQGHGEPSPTWIPVGNDVARRLAAHIRGLPGIGWTDIFDMPVTAHILGGAPIGDGPETGVIDPYHRVYGHPGLHIVDGASVSANLGVNPALTITAQAERAMAFWPHRDEADPRPPLGAGYRQIAPIMPRNPVVPMHAPAARGR